MPNFTIDDGWAGYRAASVYPLLLGVVTVVTVKRTERGDRMRARLLGGSAALVADHEAHRALA